MGSLDNLTWQALTAVLTLLGLVATVVLWRRRGAVSGLRMLAIALLPAAAYLTGTLRLVWEIGDAVLRWATRLVLSPSVWVGIALAGTSVLLLLMTGVLRRRGADQRRKPVLDSERSQRPASAPDSTGGRAGDGGDDDEMADIEAILKRHGIS